jgi:hypothetical protein
MIHPKITPNGRYLAVPMRRQEKGVVIIDLDAASNSKPGVIPIPPDLKVNWVEWANDDRLLMGLTRTWTIERSGRTFDWSVSRVIAVDRDGETPVVLFANKRSFKRARNLTDVVHPLPDDSQAVLMGSHDTSGRYNLYRVNVYTGEAELAERGNRETIDWLTDPKGVARVRWEHRWNRGLIDVYARQGDADRWDLITQYGEEEIPELNIVGFSDDPMTAIVASRQTSDYYGIFEYDVAKHTLGKALYENARFDVGEPVGRLLYDQLTTKLVGVCYVEDLWFCKYFESDLSDLQGRFEQVSATRRSSAPTPGHKIADAF